MDFNDFTTACKHFDIEVNNNQLNLFKKYYEILISWNKKFNLISRKDTSLSTILEKHFLDSLIFLPEILKLAQNIQQATQSSKLKAQFLVFDIGSGGGFPAIPIAIMEDSWSFTLCESIQKKATFLKQLIKELNLGNKVIVINDRAENLKKTKQKYNLIISRAVSKLNKIIEYSLPLLSEDGIIAAYKSKSIEDEINSVQNLIKSNKLKLEIFTKEINQVERNLVVIKK